MMVREKRPERSTHNFQHSTPNIRRIPRAVFSVVNQGDAGRHRDLQKIKKAGRESGLPWDW
jgi:hypothetical protein